MEYKIKIMKNKTGKSNIWNKIQNEINETKEKKSKIKYYESTTNEGRFAMVFEGFVYRCDLQKNSIEESLTKSEHDFMTTDYFKSVYRKLSYRIFYSKLYYHSSRNEFLIKGSLSLTRELKEGLAKYYGKHILSRGNNKNISNLEGKTTTKKKRRAKKRKNK